MGRPDLNPSTRLVGELGGKRFIAANPWPLAAIAKDLGLRTDQFRESNYVPDDVVYVIDLDALSELPPLNLLP